MNASSIIATLTDLGATIVLDGEDLVITATTGVVEPGLAEAIRANKPELLSILHAAAIIARITDLGAIIVLDDDGLAITAPTGVLTPELLEAVRENKPQLQAILRPWRPRWPPPCPACQIVDWSYNLDDSRECYRCGFRMNLPPRP